MDALMPPCAHGGPAGRAQVRAVPEDFLVRELLGFDADGDGDHVLLRVRKRSANTMWIAKRLAQIGKLHPRDIGFAGLKDRHAVAEQWFSAPLRSAMGERWVEAAEPDFEVLACERHRRKLKRGALRGNEFEILLREFEGDRAVLEQRLADLASAGAPNYFGPQRFGRSGANLEAALAWFSGGSAPGERAQRSLALSAARSALLNCVLARRVRAGAWNVLLEGDSANLDGGGSIFAVDLVDEALRRRCETMDLHPTGPMWGRGGERLGPFEQEVLDAHPLLRDGLVSAGVEAERRALRMVVRDLQWSFAGADLRLRFRLSRGSFATAVLHELIENAFAGEAPESDA